MIVIPQIILKTLMTMIVESTHGLCDENGDAHVCGTISEPSLRMAAITAVQIATGETVWPGDRAIRIKRPKISHGIFQEDG